MPPEGIFNLLFIRLFFIMVWENYFRVEFFFTLYVAFPATHWIIEYQRYYYDSKTEMAMRPCPCNFL
jgi:hypothetical protein